MELVTEFKKATFITFTAFSCKECKECSIFKTTRKKSKQPTNALERQQVMNFLKHFTGQPFVLATGIAALIHSTWSLGTLFSGIQPAVENISTFIGWIHFAGWILPALLIAIALDVGQVVTSHEIRTTGLTWQRGLTFFVFAFATYYLQWLYLAHHMPELSLSEGVSDVYRGFALTMRDTGMWLIPLLLPMSTLFYTFSGDTAQKPKIKQPSSKIEPTVDAMPFMPLEENSHVAICPDCGWQSDVKDSAKKAQQALAGHKRYCEVQ